MAFRQRPSFIPCWEEVIRTTLLSLPPAYEVRGKVMFSLCLSVHQWVQEAREIPLLAGPGPRSFPREREGGRVCPWSLVPRSFLGQRERMRGKGVPQPVLDKGGPQPQPEPGHGQLLPLDQHQGRSTPSSTSLIQDQDRGTLPPPSQSETSALDMIRCRRYASCVFMQENFPVFNNFQ